jgi:3D (Asp-Asp-Asp) domain-containing protein
MRFYLQRVGETLVRTRSWCGLFGRRLRHAVTRRFVLAPLLAIAFLFICSYYITSFNFFLIFDDDRVMVHGTYTRDPGMILAEAGIDLSGTDFVSLPQGLMSGGAAEIQIIRIFETNVSVTISGFTSLHTLQGGTVADALAAAGYTPDPRDNVRDHITPAPASPVEEGMEITVIRYTVLHEVRTEDIPYETVEQSSRNVNAGTSVITTEGELGVREYTYEVILRDGVEYRRSEPRADVVKEPVTEVIVRGTGGTIKLDCGTYRRYTRRVEIIAYAYTTENKDRKINAIGNVARRGTIAVDPKYIPLRIDVFVTSRNGSWHYGLARTEDTGRGIKGNKIDLFMDTRDECIQFGVRRGYLYILAP